MQEHIADMSHQFEVCIHPVNDYVHDLAMKYYRGATIAEIIQKTLRQIKQEKELKEAKDTASEKKESTQICRTKNKNRIDLYIIHLF